MTSTENYTIATRQLKGATEQSVAMWKQGTQLIAEQADRMATQAPVIDPTTGVTRYFAAVQRAVDLNRQLAAAWADTAKTMSGLLAWQVTSVTGGARKQIDALADAVNSQVEVVEAAVERQAELIEDDAKAEARRIRAAERAAEKAADEKAREPYVGLTKAELSDKLAERELPKAGNLDELIDRLVESDTLRAPYMCLSKDELADQLADRELPKSGTVEELIGRLVEADHVTTE